MRGVRTEAPSVLAATASPRAAPCESKLRIQTVADSTQVTTNPPPGAEATSSSSSGLSPSRISRIEP